MEARDDFKAVFERLRRDLKRGVVLRGAKGWKGVDVSRETSAVSSGSGRISVEQFRKAREILLREDDGSPRGLDGLIRKT